MSMTYERVVGESIIICTFIGDFKLEDLLQGYAISAKIIEETGQHLYRISNFTSVESNFPEVMATIKQVSAETPGGTTDKHVSAVLVGNHQWTRMAQDFLKRPQFGALYIPIFNSVEDGLTAIRFFMNERKRLGI
jgi:hypothetical protein